VQPATCSPQSFLDVEPSGWFPGFLGGFARQAYGIPIPLFFFFSASLSDFIQCFPTPEPEVFRLSPTCLCHSFWTNQAYLQGDTGMTNNLSPPVCPECLTPRPLFPSFRLDEDLLRMPYLTAHHFGQEMLPTRTSGISLFDTRRPCHQSKDPFSPACNVCGNSRLAWLFLLRVFSPRLFENDKVSPFRPLPPFPAGLTISLPGLFIFFPGMQLRD